MTTNANTPTGKAKNYSDAQVLELTDYSVDCNHNLASAKLFAAKFGKSYQSVISKIKNLELPYDVKPAPRKKAVQATKADFVSVISAKLDRDLTGLEKAPRDVLLMLINGLQHALPVDEPAELPNPGDSVK